MKIMRNLMLGLLLFAASQAHAAPIGDIISYQGKLTKGCGNWKFGRSRGWECGSAGIARLAGPLRTGPAAEQP